MKERFPSVPLQRLGPKGEPGGLSVMYQLLLFVAPLIVSQTRVVPAIKWPQPVVGPAGPQSSPPGMPPWNILIGRMNDCKSPLHPPVLLVHEAPELVQLLVQRLRPPLLLPCQKRRLPGS